MEIIGRAEKIDFPSHGLSDIYARIDTGAKTSALWASNITIQGDKISFNFFGPEDPHYAVQPIQLDGYSKTVVSNSSGDPEIRYKIKLPIRLGGKTIKTSFTLTDRSSQVYPVLIGRNTLKGKFLVDVKKGDVMLDKERKKTADLQKLLEEVERN